MNQNLKEAIKALRVVGVEAVTKAKSGHPGIVLGAAPILATLFAKHLVYAPSNHSFFNRDRFVLSAGHGSALLYSLFAACEYDNILVDDLKDFRQVDSICPGHPERSKFNELSIGVEITTGPLGQGVAAAVGMAIAEARLHALYQVNGKSLVDHYTYCLFGDGCMQEGIFHEALSVAAYYNLKKLILLYDSNKIQLDGPTANSECLNHAKYFDALNIHYQVVEDGEDTNAIATAIATAKATDRPSVIEVKTIIGAHSRKQNTSAVHGAPLSAEDVQALRDELDYHAPAFTYEPVVYEAFKDLKSRGESAEKEFNKLLKEFKKADYKEYKNFCKLMLNDFNLSFLDEVKDLTFDFEASRNVVGKIYQKVIKNNPTITTLNADLSGSTKIAHLNQPLASATNHAAPNWNMGVRELAMQGINNGITAHGGVLGVGSTFLAFADYVKPALRVGAISELSTLTVFSHDSITVGEDGPTHEPIEQLEMLRSTPNVYVCRPCNAQEAGYAFNLWLDKTINFGSPVVISTSRTPFKMIKADLKDVAQGAYIIYGPSEGADVGILATGSEVALAVEVAKILEAQNYKVKVISFWCKELLAETGSDLSFLSSKMLFSIEYGAISGWYQLVDYAFGLEEFGLSGKAEDVIKDLGVDAATIADQIVSLIGLVKS